MSAFVLKLIAITTMFFDHSSFLIYGPGFSWMRCIGRLAFPIFAFQISEGFLHTKNLKKYYLRLILFALISEIPYIWFDMTFIGEPSLNIIFTLILGLFSINIYNYFVKLYNNKNPFNTKLIGFICVFIIAFLAEQLSFDYGYYGVLLIFSFYLFHENKVLMNISAILLTFIYFLPNLILYNFHKYYVILFLCTLVPLIFINLYNGKKGKNLKWFFYIFYPVHLIIICILYQTL